jgi:hypothetical protein
VTLEKAIQAELEGFFAPLSSIAADAGDDALKALLRAAGWDVPQLQGALDGTKTALNALDKATTTVLAKIKAGDLIGVGTALGEVGTACYTAFTSIRKSLDDPALGLDGEARSTAAADVLVALCELYFRSRWPRVLGILRSLGIVQFKDRVAVAVATSPIKGRRLVFDLERIGQLITDPIGLLKVLYKNDDVAAAANGLLRKIADTAVPAMQDAGIALYDVVLDVSSVPTNALVLDVLDDTGALPVGFRAVVAADLDGADIAVIVAADGRLDVKLPLGGQTLSLSTNAVLNPIRLSAQGVEPASAVAASAKLDIAYSRGELGPGKPWAMLLGSDKGIHLRVEQLVVSGGVDLDVLPGQLVQLDPHLEVKLRQLGIGVAAGDGFLSSLFPDGAGAAFDLDLRWSRKKGLRLGEGTATEYTHRKSIELGPIKLTNLAVGIKPTTSTPGVSLAATTDIEGALGPVAVTVRRLGIAIVLRSATKPNDVPDAVGALGPLDVGVAIKPPSGLGVAINAGPVSGGGFLDLDFERGEYAGVFELSIKVVSLKAIGLVNTKLPDGRAGFSMIVIVTFEFPPIQLGFGFTLNGLGGIVGIHRAFDTKVLREGLKDGSLNSILFPKDAAKNANKILSDIRKVFPQQQNNYVFGVMVKLGWGPAGLLEIEVGLAVALPNPIKLVVLGRIGAYIPDRKAPIVELHLDVVGVLDFERSELMIEARLYDSRIALFNITGGMAMRVSWGASKGFALSVGGFHPKFRPPAEFPKLDRLTVTLAVGDYVRIRLTSYLAITSNSFQFGAQLDLYVGVTILGFKIEIRGEFGFDVLIEFKPFKLLAALRIAVKISVGGVVLFALTFEGELEGPSPWHAAGFVEFQIAFFKIRAAASITIGDPDSAGVPRIDLVRKFSASIADKSVFAVERSTSVPSTTIAITPTSDSTSQTALPLVVDPAGRLSLSQQGLPLGKRIEWLGGDLPLETDPEQFAVAKVEVGTRVVPLDQVRFESRSFAPGIYEKLTNDQKLSRPAFETMRSGVSFQSTSWKVPTGADGIPTYATVAMTYDELVVDRVPEDPPRQTKEVKFEAEALSVLLNSGAAAYPPRLRSGDFAFEGPERACVVQEERFVKSSRNRLTASGGQRSYAELADTADDYQIITAAEVGA